MSTGAVFIRLAEASPIVVAAYRTGLAFAALAPVAWVKARREIASLSLSDLMLSAFSGLLLACHFAAWIASLDYTSIACSVVLVNTNPLWVAVLAPFVTGETIGKGRAAGIGISILGAVFIGAGDFGGGGRALFGDALAVGGSIAMACYLLLGARLRRKLSLLAYVTLCYGAAAAVLWVAVLAFGLRFMGLPEHTYAAVVSLAFMAQLIGHSCYNWSLKWLSTSMVAVSLLGEPIGGTILGYIVFGENLSVWKAGGGALILAGIYTASVSEKPATTGGTPVKPSSL
jgi:drug/metabolite transporter (DMT)-like permease